MSKKKGTSVEPLPLGICFVWCLRLGRSGDFLASGALDAGGLATEFAEVIEARAAHIAPAYDVDGSDGGGVQWEDALHTSAKTDAAHREAGAAGAALSGNHYA